MTSEHFRSLKARIEELTLRDGHLHWRQKSCSSGSGRWKWWQGEIDATRKEIEAYWLEIEQALKHEVRT